jgi:hypothetical protein
MNAQQQAAPSFGANCSSGGRDQVSRSNFKFCKKNFEILVCALGLLNTACNKDLGIQTQDSSLKTVAFTRWNKKNLTTCWEFTSSSTQSFRNEIQSQVERAFGESVVKFGGWQKCSPNTPLDVKVFIYDDAGSVLDEEFRTYVDSLIFQNGSQQQGAGHPRLRDTNRPMRVVLNQSFKDADSDFLDLFAQLTAQGQKNMALTAAIHEFGHVIGLRHEDAHPERSCDEFAEQPGDVPGELLIVSPYNPFSFMSRCYYRTFNHNLSILYPNKKDIEGINALYADVGQ